MSEHTTTNPYAALLARLDLRTKVRLLTGETAFTLWGEDSIGLAPMAFSDGPTGVRGLKFTGGEKVALFPNATVLASAWSEDTAREVGSMLAEEAERQQIHVVLGPQGEGGLAGQQAHLGAQVESSEQRGIRVGGGVL